MIAERALLAAVLVVAVVLLAELYLHLTSGYLP